MNLLITAATELEIAPFLQVINSKPYAVDILISGVGMVPTTFTLTKKLSEKKYDAILNVGIAGSFSRDIMPGSLVRVQKDSFSELGAQNDSTFLSIDELGFGTSIYYEKAKPFLKYPLVTNLKTVEGITVNKVHGNETSINKVINRLNPEIESMEGAATFYVAQQLNIHSLQVRCISNFVEKRDRSNWQIDLAVQNLNNWLAKFISEL